MVLGKLQKGLMLKICKLLGSKDATRRNGKDAAAKSKEKRAAAREQWRQLAGFDEASVDATAPAQQNTATVLTPAKAKAPTPVPEKFKLPYITPEAARACSNLLGQVLHLGELGVSVSEVETLTRGSNDEAKAHSGVRRSIGLATALARGVMCDEPASTRPEILIAAVSWVGGGRGQQ